MVIDIVPDQNCRAIGGEVIAGEGNIIGNADGIRELEGVYGFLTFDHPDFDNGNIPARILCNRKSSGFCTMSIFIRASGRLNTRSGFPVLTAHREFLVSGDICETAFTDVIHNQD